MMDTANRFLTPECPHVSCGELEAIEELTLTTIGEPEHYAYTKGPDRHRMCGLCAGRLLGRIISDAFQHEQPTAPGDLVQLDPASELGKSWGPQVCVVSEVKPWGVKAYFVATRERGDFGQAFLRLEAGSYRRVGRAEWAAQ